MDKKTFRFLFFLGLIAASFIALLLFKSADYSSRIKKLDALVISDLNRYGVDGSDLIHRSLKKNYLIKEFSVPAAFSFKNYEKALKKKLSDSGYEISQTKLKKSGNELILALVIKFRQRDIYSLSLHQKIAVVTPVAPAKPFVYPSGGGKMAIVLDDWGYNLKDLAVIWEINRPLTLAILPQRYTKLKLSPQIAQTAFSKKYEVILHLPLEPKEYQGKDNSGFITTDMNKEEVIKILNSNLDNVPYARGINNHEGSRATEDYELMKTILGQMKKHRLYFLDSLTSDNSVCLEVARELKLKFAQRDIFLDNEEDKEYIKNQLRKLAVLAIKEGRAIGIGHDRPNTLAAIKEMVPELEKAGIKFVFLSEMVE